MKQDSPRLRRYALVVCICGALPLLILWLYERTFHYTFANIDDNIYVFMNPQVQAGLSADGVRWAFTKFDGFWHPLTWLSLQLDATLYGGQNPGGFHRTNVLLHTANTLLLFLVLSRMTGLVWRSALVAALFALHPLNVESVTWVAERKGLLSTFFWMLTLAAYLSYIRRPSVHRYLLVVLGLLFGLMAKPMLMTLPFVLLLLDYWPLGRLDGRTAACRLLFEKVPLFALVLGWMVIAFLAERHGGALASLDQFPMSVRIENALLSYVRYLGKAFWPSCLAVHYPHPGARRSLMAAFAAGLVLLVITALVLGPGRRRPYLTVGWLWFLGTLVPVIGLVQISSHAMADRYAYVPLVGLFLVLSWGACDLAMAWHLPRRALVGLGAAVLGACALVSRVQVGYWSSDLALWAHAEQVTDNNVLAHFCLGYEFLQMGRLELAEGHFTKALVIMPTSSRAHNGLGEVLYAQKRLPEAEAHLRKAIELNPPFAEPHQNLGLVLCAQGKYEEALTEYERALALDSGLPLPHYGMGEVLERQGRLEEALAEYRQALARGLTEASERLRQCEQQVAEQGGAEEP